MQFLVCFTYLALFFQWLCTLLLHSLPLLGVSWLPWRQLVSTSLGLVASEKFFTPSSCQVAISMCKALHTHTHKKDLLRLHQSLQLEQKNSKLFQFSLPCLKQVHTLHFRLRKLIEQPPCFLAIFPAKFWRLARSFFGCLITIAMRTQCLPEAELERKCPLRRGLSRLEHPQLYQPSRWKGYRILRSILQKRTEYQGRYLTKNGIHKVVSYQAY